MYCFASAPKKIQHGPVEIPRIPVRDEVISLHENEFCVRDGFRNQARMHLFDYIARSGDDQRFRPDPGKLRRRHVRFVTIKPSISAFRPADSLFAEKHLAILYPISIGIWTRLFTPDAFRFAPFRISRSTRSGCCRANTIATFAPSENPSR